MELNTLKFFESGWTRYIGVNFDSNDWFKPEYKEQRERVMRKYHQSRANLSFYESLSSANYKEYNVKAVEMHNLVLAILEQIKKHVMPFFEDKPYIILDDTWIPDDEWYWAETKLFIKDGIIYFERLKDVGWRTAPCSTELDNLYDKEVIGLFEQLKKMTKKDLQKRSNILY